MKTNILGVSNKATTATGRRRHLPLLGAAFLMTLLFVSINANAQSVRFRYVGGSWSHARHAGWNRYWGGPSVGFYYAPAPVYVVPGYAAPSYYTSSSFWYSNPSFGLSLNFGGGSSYYGSGYHGRPVYNNYHTNEYYHDSGHSYRSTGYASHGEREAHGGSFHGGGGRERR